MKQFYVRNFKLLIREQNKHSEIAYKSCEPIGSLCVRKGGPSSKLTKGKILAIASAKPNRRMIYKSSFGNIAPITTVWRP